MLSGDSVTYTTVMGLLAIRLLVWQIKKTGLTPDDSTLGVTNGLGRGLEVDYMDSISIYSTWATRECGSPSLVDAGKLVISISDRFFCVILWRGLKPRHAKLV